MLTSARVRATKLVFSSQVPYIQYYTVRNRSYIYVIISSLSVSRCVVLEPFPLCFAEHITTTATAGVADTASSALWCRYSGEFLLTIVLIY